MTIRIAKDSDAPKLSVLVADFRRFYKAEENVSGCNAFVQERLVKNDSLILVAEDDNTLCGYAHLFHSFSTIGLENTFILNDLFVAQNYRGRHVSDLLLKSVIDYSKFFGKKQIWLLTAEDNSIAQNLYKKYNFKTTKFKHYVCTIKN